VRLRARAGYNSPSWRAINAPGARRAARRIALCIILRLLRVTLRYTSDRCGANQPATTYMPHGIRCTFADRSYRSPRVLFPFKEYVDAADPPRDPARLETADRVFIAPRCFAIAQVRNARGMHFGDHLRIAIARRMPAKYRAARFSLLAFAARHGTISALFFSFTTTRLSIFNRSRYLYSLFSMLRVINFYYSVPNTFHVI
jgi:hypothetical protein